MYGNTNDTDEWPGLQFLRTNQRLMTNKKYCVVHHWIDYTSHTLARRTSLENLQYPFPYNMPLKLIFKYIHGRQKKYTGQEGKRKNQLFPESNSGVTTPRQKLVFPNPSKYHCQRSLPIWLRHTGSNCITCRQTPL